MPRDTDAVVQSIRFEREQWKAVQRIAARRTYEHPDHPISAAEWVRQAVEYCLTMEANANEPNTRRRK